MRFTGRGQSEGRIRREGLYALSCDDSVEVMRRERLLMVENSLPLAAPSQDVWIREVAEGNWWFP